MSEITFKGKTYYLLYNGAAMFELQDIENIYEAITGDFEAFCRIVATLSRQGELLRRYEGYDAGKVLDEEILRITALPYEVLELQQAVTKAILAGMKREVEEDKKERDLSLEKFKKKPGKTTNSAEPTT